MSSPKTTNQSADAEHHGDEQTPEASSVQSQRVEDKPLENSAEQVAVRPSGSRRYWIKLLLQPALLLVIGALLIFKLGVAQRMGWISPSESGDAPTAAAGGHVRYICPMMCTPPQDEPGRCPVCGMELVPATTGGEAGDGRSIVIDPVARRIANISTVAVESAPQTRRIRVIGQLRYDEGALASISSYVDGRIERLYADYTGVAVRQGDQLALVYSPELYSAQVELIQAGRFLVGTSSSTLARVQESQERLYQSSRRKLIELGMTETQVASLEQAGEADSRLHLHSPISGTVIERLAVEGQYVKTGEPIYRIADLSKVWLMLDLFPEDAAAVRYGQQVEAELQSLPGRRFRGRVAFVDPVVNPRTRTIGVRVVLPNDEGHLRIGDYARASIEVQLTPSGEAAAEIYDAELAGRWISPRHPHVIEDEPGPCRVCGIPLVSASRFGFAEQPVEPKGVLVIPRNAVLMAGENSVVYVEVEPGRFEIRPVVLGPSIGDRIVIVEGVKQGEQVALSGNFLIDSQMQLAGNPSLIDPSRARVKPEKKVDGPLELERGDMHLIAGDAGEELERLYQAYFTVQATLADDRALLLEQSQPLHELAAHLQTSEKLSPAARTRLATVAQHSQSLHSLAIDEARVAFKPISKSILQLAAQVRGEGAETSFIHFYCSMVPDGEGDWLQPAAPLANPYWGSKMLRCGIAAGELPPSGIVEDAAATPSCCEESSEPGPVAGPSCCEAASSTQEFDEQAEPKPAAKPSCCDESIPARAREETKP
jgi:membrane fusion protein, copper/silver efflux system